jgi:hypothetical protein
VNLFNEAVEAIRMVPIVSVSSTVYGVLAKIFDSQMFYGYRINIRLTSKFVKNKSAYFAVSSVTQMFFVTLTPLLFSSNKVPRPPPPFPELASTKSFIFQV